MYGGGVGRVEPGYKEIYGDIQCELREESEAVLPDDLLQLLRVPPHQVRPAGQRVLLPTK